MSGTPPITVRLRTHADNMQLEGWYTTANVLDEAATEIEHLLTENTRLRLALTGADGQSVADKDISTAAPKE